MVSVTRLRVRSWRYLPLFLVQAFRSARQAAKAEGNLAVRVLRDREKTFWTATMWTSEEAIKHYMLSGVHGRVMRRLLDWCDEAALVRWIQETTDLPTWPESFARLQGEGRPSKVRKPSRSQTAFTYPEPLVRSAAELRFK